MDYRSISKQHDNEFDEPDHGNDGEKKQMIIKKNSRPFSAAGLVLNS